MDKDLDGARIAMTATTNGRSADRVLTRLKAYCSYGRVEGTATLANISYSGALIENTTMRPEMGTRVVLHVHLKPPEAFRAATPFEVTGHSVRHSSTGFAIEFTNRFDPGVRRMVDDAEVILAASG